MKVGIISKEAHAKSHAAALEEAGFLPVMLGSNPNEVPATIPLVVCRTLSCAHGGMDTALAWSRGGGGRLIVENGVKRMLKKALHFRSEVEGTPAPMVTEADTASEVALASCEDLREAAQVLADARPDDPYELLVDVMRRMYPKEEVSLLRSVVASIRAPVPAPAPPAPTAECIPVQPPSPKPYPKRLASYIAESAVDVRMEKAWGVRDSLTNEQAMSIGKWASTGAEGNIPHGDLLRKLNRNPVGFSGLLLLCTETPLAMKDLSRAYSRVFGKVLFAPLAEAAAWWLGVSLTGATKTNPNPDTPKSAEGPPVPAAKPEIIPDPVPTPAKGDEHTLAVLKALSVSLDRLLTRVEELDERVVDLTTRINNMPHAPVVTGTVSTGDALAALAAKGLEVVVRTPSR